MATTILLTAAWSASIAPPAGAVTIGQLAPPTNGSTCGATNTDLVQPAVGSGRGYVVPPFGARITSWSHQARGGAGQILSFRVFRKVADPATFQVVGFDGPRPLVPGVVNTFAVDVAVQPGDVIGLSHNAVSAPTGCIFTASGLGWLRTGNLGFGQSGAFNSALGVRVNATAEVVPSNEFGLRKVKRKKKKGIAILEVDLPGPGELTLAGKGVRTSGPGTSRTVDGPGAVRVRVRAKGGKLKRLKRRGKAKVIPTLIFTPTVPAGGEPNTKTRPTKLLRRKPKRKR